MNVFWKTETIELRGVSRGEIEAFFLESGWENASPGVWSFSGGEVRIGDPATAALGAIRLPSVTLVFRLAESAFDEALSAFRSRFLRAGG